eukprot:TRINITY_DN535_c0_g1_i1.p1 TRINITY_DN535_c0_g1~~TRINITY_DN535_c0_g1_i1.p1  ORF type:complete len:449 (+),score=67.77 TRINITY_DN535_c0_g1_i1:42-1388(+)
MTSNTDVGEDGRDLKEEENNIHMWKIKKLIQKLENARGAGTSMISLIIPPKDQVARYNKMLADEYGTASNIKNRVNRLSVLGAITSTKEKLKLYPRVPTNGLVVYCGEILTEDGKEKKVNIAFEPHKPINTSLYLCDNKFHTEALSELLESDLKYGFVVVDGSGTLYGTLSGNTRAVLHKFTVELPKKHGRGGQSSVRFARLRLEKRHNYLRKVAEGCTQHFIAPDNQPNVSGLILAGLADFKNDLFGSDMFDPRLKKVVVDIVDTSYGFENGFNQAIELSAERLRDVKFIKEKKLVSSFFDEIAQDTGKYCFGFRDSLYACEGGAVHTLIVYDNLDLDRYLVSTPDQGDKVIYLSTAQGEKEDAFKDPQTGQDWEVKEKTSLVEWLAENYKKFGCSLQFVTDRSQEGMQFVKGFGGIGALLRYKLEFSVLDMEEERKNDEDDYDYFY